MTLFLTVRIADILTTLVGYHKGILELMPVSKALLDISPIAFTTVNLLLSVILGYIAIRISPLALKVFTVLNTLVVVGNIIIIAMV